MCIEFLSLKATNLLLQKINLASCSGELLKLLNIRSGHVRHWSRVVLLLDLPQADKPSTPVSKVTTPTCSGAPTLPGSSGVKSAVPGVVLPPGAYPPFSLVAGGVGGSRSSDTSPYNSVAPSPYSRPPMVGFQKE